MKSIQYCLANIKNSTPTVYKQAPKTALKVKLCMKNKVYDASTNTDMSFPFSGNVSIEASQESFEIDNHINTNISENSDNSFHLSQTESKTDDEKIQNSQCNYSY